jgi:hypothetical protein
LHLPVDIGFTYKIIVLAAFNTPNNIVQAKLFVIWLVYYGDTLIDQKMMDQNENYNAIALLTS